MDRIDPAGHSRRWTEEIQAMMSWPLKVVGMEVHEVNGHRWEVEVHEPYTRAEIEAEGIEIDEELRRWFEETDRLMRGSNERSVAKRSE
jgi:hypothetical protein